MKTKLTLFVSLLLSYNVAMTQAVKPSFSASLDTSNGKTLLQQCSRTTPNNIAMYWVVPQQAIDTLEYFYLNLDTVKSIGCCFPGGQVDSLNKYGVQYIGVLIDDVKYIYINAFPISVVTLQKRLDPKFDAQKSSIVVCDGGERFWGALFDIKKKIFSHLTFNGRGG